MMVYHNTLPTESMKETSLSLCIFEQAISRQNHTRDDIWSKGEHWLEL